MRPISVNDDLAPNDASVADWPADDKTSRPIHRHAIRWQLAKERNNGVFGESFFDAPLNRLRLALAIDFGRVLDGDNHAIYLAVGSEGHLRFGVGSNPRGNPRTAQLLNAQA